MSLFADRVKETSTTTGTGDFTLAGAVASFITFSTPFAVGNEFTYCIQHQTASEWEVGVGYLSASTTLVRKTITASSNSDSAVSFSAGTKDVFCTIPAEFCNKLNGYKNKLINGNFNIWQYGTSQTINGYGSADRWLNSHVGTTDTTSLQSFALGQTAVPNNPTFFIRHVVTSVAGASNYALMTQRIEGVETFSGTTATLSFWAKANASKNIAVEFVQNFGTGGTPSSFVAAIGVTTCALTTAWKKFTVTVAIPSISGKTLGTSGDDWLGVYFWFDAGSASNTRTNSLGQQSGTFDIAQVQLESGDIATQFESRHIAMELDLCQRYMITFSRMLGAQYATTGSVIATNYPVSMRTTPTSNLAIAALNIIGVTTATTLSIAATVITNNYVRLNITHDAVGAIGRPVEGTLTGYIEAEL